MAITYHIDYNKFNITERRVLNDWLRFIAKCEGYKIGSVNIIFTNSENVLAINREFLQHDYFTDIITFDDSELDKKTINGELYIDVDTVADNAQQYGIDKIIEIYRVVAHGILHLCGQGDKGPEEEKVMRAKEDKALDNLEFLTYCNGGQVFQLQGGIKF